MQFSEISFIMYLYYSTTAVVQIYLLRRVTIIMEVLKVSSHSSPNSVAGAIAGVIREQKAVEVQAVGAGAANQAIKAIAIARGYLAPIGIDLICIPAFANIQIDGEERTAMKFICEQR